VDTAAGSAGRAGTVVIDACDRVPTVPMPSRPRDAQWVGMELSWPVATVSLGDTFDRGEMCRRTVLGTPLTWSRME
jgi:hypothetical protein